MVYMHIKLHHFYFIELLIIFEWWLRNNLSDEGHI